jgi:UDP-N-acetylglucosamine 1-carboxyvinyltransferase
MGCNVTTGDDWIRVKSDGNLTSASIKTQYYPGFPTDLHPQMTALLSQAEGISYVTEAVFDNRFQYIDQLVRLGAKIKVEGRMAVVEGASRLTGADVMATDLRGGACLIVGALAAIGMTRITNVHYIDRGYENIEEKLSALGANIRRAGNEDDAPVILEA